MAELTAEGLNLEGIRRVLALEVENERLRHELAEAHRRVERAEAEAERRQRRDLVPLRQAVAVYGEVPSVLRRGR